MPNRQRHGIRPLSAMLLGVLASGPAAAGGEAAVQLRVAEGQKACIDPATGQLVTPDRSPECAAALAAANEAATEPLRAQGGGAGSREEQPLEGGGSKVDLDGQLRQNHAMPDAGAAPAPSGLIAIIDPATGRPVSGAAAEALLRQSPVAREAMQEFANQVGEMATADVDATGLQEQEIETGGVKVDLEGRFRSPLAARVGADGTITVEHPAPKVD